jgi:DNA-binding response OmpR family regulator
VDDNTGEKQQVPAKVSRILFVEQDEEMRALIISQLPAAQYKIDEVPTGMDALKKIAATEYDVVMANWTLPELSCLELIKRIREQKSQAQLAILVLTSTTQEEVLAQMIEAGATDFLMKPFDRATLLNRVKGISLRFKTDDEKTILETGKLILGEITLDTRSFDVYCKSERVHLTPSEFKLLHALAIRKGSVLTRENLIQLVQGEGIAVIDRAVDTHIFSLRKKLAHCADVIETVRGFGYRVRA